MDAILKPDENAAECPPITLTTKVYNFHAQNPHSQPWAAITYESELCKPLTRTVGVQTDSFEYLCTRHEHERAMELLATILKNQHTVNLLESGLKPKFRIKYLPPPRPSHSNRIVKVRYRSKPLQLKYSKRKNQVDNYGPPSKRSRHTDAVAAIYAGKGTAFASTSIASTSKTSLQAAFPRIASARPRSLSSAMKLLFKNNKLDLISKARKECKAGAKANVGENSEQLNIETSKASESYATKEYWEEKDAKIDTLMGNLKKTLKESYDALQDPYKACPRRRRTRDDPQEDA